MKSQENSEKKEYKQMSVEKLRSFKGLENLSDEEAKAIIEQLEKFSFIAFELFQKEKSGKRNATVYLRTSSSSKLNPKDNIEKQEKYCRTFAKENNLKVVRVFA